jgi:hypothetical protein
MRRPTSGVTSSTSRRSHWESRDQGLTLVHYSPQRKHCLRNAWGGSSDEMAQVEPKSGRVSAPARDPPAESSACSKHFCPAESQKRKLKLKAKFESSLSHFIIFVHLILQV